MDDSSDVAGAAPADSAEVFTDLRGWMAQLVVLKDQGHLPNVTFGDDDDSRQFVQDVRRLNRSWKLGQIAKVPTPTSTHQLDVRSAPRPREHAPRVRRTRTTPRASRDGPDEPEPGLARLVDLTRLQAALLPFVCSMELAGDLDERELEAFISIASIRFAREASRLRWWEAA
jgi:hypothetical protein